ncbi:HET-domain-containing protein [Corynespora cassiicola Philippines]|uniref:HET-domain-containing protein n=1 Tax=Corynespora cassiicola Philippines TaxID=1448308 RepID=A0A2T2NG27_CORCC|nr:HET-domain-containing protein [Corynespora cassiicola Philippines]
MAQSSPLGPLCFVNDEDLRESREAVCNICNEKCLYGIRYSCTECPNFHICDACFGTQNYTHADHEFVEVDLAYLMKKFGKSIKKRPWSVKGLVRENIRCYTCLDHRPDKFDPAWIVRDSEQEYDRSQDVLDASRLSQKQKSIWNELQKEIGLEPKGAFFLLHQYGWNLKEAAQGFYSAFNADTKLGGTMILELERADGWMSSLSIYPSDLARSGERGCQLCSLVYRGLAIAEPSMVAADPRIQMLIEPTEIGINSPREEARGERNVWKWCFHARPGVQPPWPSLISRNYPGHFSSSRCFDTIKDWIRECETSHGHHRCSSKDTPLPHRLLALGNHVNEPALRLVNIENGTYGRYIALSHCWGTITTVKTLNSNIAAMYQGIHLEDLPKTFIDAVYCARMLNVKYLWIDTLCIIQDSVLDWQVESAKMCLYYRGAWLVIIAASAEGDTDGFLGYRNQRYQGIALESECDSGKFDVCIHRTIPHVESMRDLESGFTRLRAWCLQEQVLACRSVTFHTMEMVWECHSSTKCECGTSNLVFEFNSAASNVQDQWYLSKDHHYDPGLNGLPKARLAGFIHTWNYIGKPYTWFKSDSSVYEEWRFLTVPLYSERSLTKIGDKLPALSGVADLVAPQIKDHYLAGIWSRDIQLGLLWELRRGVKKGPVMDLPMAPSFSWASVNKSISYHIPGGIIKGGPNYAPYGDTNIRLIDWSISLAGSNKYGAVTGGYIQVSGLLSHLSLTLSQGQMHLKVVGADNIAPNTWSSFSSDTYLEVSMCRDKDGRSEPTVRRSRKPPADQEDFDIQVDCIIVADSKLPCNWTKTTPSGSETTPSNADSNIPDTIATPLDTEPTLPEYVSTIADSLPVLIGMEDDARDRCLDYAVLILGKIEPWGNSWRYERLGRAVLVFEPEVAKRWIGKAQEKEIIIC